MTLVHCKMFELSSSVASKWTCTCLLFLEEQCGSANRWHAWHTSLAWDHSVNMALKQPHGSHGSMLLLFFHTGCCVNACSFISSVWKVQAKWHHWWAVDLSCVSSSMVCSYHLLFHQPYNTHKYSHTMDLKQNKDFLFVCVLSGLSLHL